MDRPVRNNIILQVRTNRASTSWCRTEERYFLFLRERENERLVRMLTELGRIDLEININNSTFSLDLCHFQSVFV